MVLFKTRPLLNLKLSILTDDVFKESRKCFRGHLNYLSIISMYKTTRSLNFQEKHTHIYYQFKFPENKAT